MSDVAAHQPDPKPVDLHVGKIVRAKRRILGWSQQTLADTLGVSFQQIQKYERGANRISCSTLARIAEAFNAPYDDFFPPRPDAGRLVPGLGAAGEMVGAGAGLALARCWIRMAPEKRHALLQVAGVLVDDDAADYSYADEAARAALPGRADA